MNHEDAERRLKIFEHGHGSALMQLASHAALPVVLNPDFVHLLRVNYFLDPPVTLPYTAEAELLLSPLCTEVDQGLYVIDPEMRDVLLQHLVEEYGSGRLHDIARLLWEYGQRSMPWPDRPGLPEAQQLTALNFIDPARAQDWLARAEESTGPGTAVDQRWFVAMRQDLENRTAAVQRPKEQAGPQEPANKSELRRVWERLADEGYALTTEWDIGLPPRIGRDLRETYYDGGQLRSDIEDNGTRESARDVIIYEWTNDGLWLEEYATITIADRSRIKGERIHKRIVILQDLAFKNLVEQFLSLVPPDRRQNKGTFGVDFARTYSCPVTKPHRHDEEFIIIYVLERIGDGAETYLYRWDNARHGDKDDGEQVLWKQLNAGDILIFDDSQFKHGTTPLQSLPGETAMRDTLVCTVDYPTTYLERKPVS